MLTWLVTLWVATFYQTCFPRFQTVEFPCYLTEIWRGTTDVSSAGTSFLFYFFVATKEDFTVISLMRQLVNSSFQISTNDALRNTGSKRED